MVCTRGLVCLAAFDNHNDGTDSRVGAGMSVYETMFYGNTIAGWLVAVALALAVVLALRFARGTVARRLSAMVADTETEIDDLVLEMVWTGRNSRSC